MNKRLLLTGTILAGILLSISFGNEVIAQNDKEETNLQVLDDDKKGERSELIPSWIDQSFIWYAQKQISQTELINSLEFLAKERIILLPSNVQTAEAQEITESIEDLQAKFSEIDSFDEQELTAILAIEDAEERELKCSNAKKWIIRWTCKAFDIGIEVLNKGVEEEQMKTRQQLGVIEQEIKKAEIANIEEKSNLSAGTISTYVKYKKGVPDNFKLTVECDAGDVATGGGFAPSLSGDSNTSYHASMPYPTNYANNPRMNNPIGWTYYSADSGEARVWVVCLDLTPSKITAGTNP